MNSESLLSLFQQAIPYYVGFNLFLLFGFAYNRIACYVIRDWPSVSGRVTSSEVYRSLTHAKHGASMRVTPLINYTYEVNGETYINQRIAPGLGITGKYVQDMVKRFPTGSQVTVYYLPEGPIVSFLSKKSLIEPYLLQYFILGNLLMPLVVLFVNFVKGTIFKF